MRNVVWRSGAHGLAIGGMCILLGGQIQAAQYYVNGSQGQDRSACVSTPGPGTAACKTIQYLTGNADLGGGDVVRVAPGIYHGGFTVEDADSGTAGNPVTFLADGGQVILEGTDPVPLDDATAQQCTATLNCAGNGTAYPMVWRFNIGTRALTDVIETVWTPIRVDDSVVTGVVFDLTKPLPSKGVLSIAEVQQISGSWFRSGSYLYVHTFQDVAPSTTANNVEILAYDAVVIVRGDNVTFDGFTIRYAGDYGFLVSGGAFVTLRNAIVHSVGGMAVMYNSGATNGTIENVEVSHAYNRKQFTVPDQSGAMCYTAECGWYNNAGGTGLKIDGGDNGATGFMVKNVTAYNSWNVVSVEEISYSTFVDVLAKNSPNHTFIISGNATASKCHHVTLKRTLAFNGQDSFYIAGCTNGLAIRNAFGAFLGEANAVTASTTGWRIRGVLSDTGINLAADATPGFSTNRNWLNQTGTLCKAGAVRYGCNTAEWRALGYDLNSRFTAVKLAGFTTWPLGPGLAISTKTRADFYPVSGSSTIDAGDPDLDGDGVLETGSGGDDECTAAHNCAGAGPDIGPFEFGLASGQPPSVDPPPPPDNVQRSDTR